MLYSNKLRAFFKCAFLALMRVAVFYGWKIQDLIDLLKEAFVQAAEEAVELHGREVNVSNLSVITGLQRKDVSRIIGKSPPKERSKHHFFAEILARWQGLHNSKDEQGRCLGYVGVDSEFAQLVKAVSTDLNPYTILSELERLNLVTREEQGLRLLQSVYKPGSGEDLDGFEILGDDIIDLIGSVSENIKSEEIPPNHHIRTYFDNIPEESVQTLRNWLKSTGEKVHQRVREYLLKIDLDTSVGRSTQKKSNTKGGVQVTFTSFSKIVLPEKEESE